MGNRIKAHVHPVSVRAAPPSTLNAKPLPHLWHEKFWWDILVLVNIGETALLYSRESVEHDGRGRWGQVV